jgi:biopolymer transport protein ExbD
MNGHDIVAALSTLGLSDGVAVRVIQRAARQAPGVLSDRLEEEWLAELSEQRGRMSRLSFALGCYWAATVISHDQLTVNLPVTSSPPGDKTMTAYAHYRGALFSRRTTAAAPGILMCDINTTPLIDVMLVLLVTMIISLPVMTHAVKLELPQTPLDQQTRPPEVINLDIDFDGTVVWNGTAIASLQQLETYLHAEAQKDPQPQIHLRPDRRAKYDFVARVLASAQRNRMQKIGFANTGEFRD